ncbi:MAG: PHP domain-containing protein [Acidobacteria bacterium]|nr:PHP domain-containing protein [Acidobacteriota bacterium]MDP7471301.1 Sb-PDE family phosphodiesterase [Vicinamibacterales bacterium]
MTGRLSIVVVTAFWMGGTLAAQERAIQFPDVPGYQTLSVDLHTHSVFSDGLVWPDIRIDEARRDGLDLIAVTEHLEYQPHEDDIPHPDRNRSFELATGHVERQESDLLVVNGAEITRDMPPGHVNAVFLSDANALLSDNAMEAFRAADRQGAFVFWNHPAWTSQRPDGIARLTDMHRDLIRSGLLHGIEVANGAGYTAEALQIAFDLNLTILGVSDIHGLIDWDYNVHGGGHRTVTLVLARERTADAVREALMARRTIAWFNNLLIGREDALMPLLETSLTVSGAVLRGESEVVGVTLSNGSDAAFELRSVSAHRFAEHSTVVRVPPHGEVVLGVTGETRSAFDLEFEVLNAVTAPDTHPSLRLRVDVDGR